MHGPFFFLIQFYVPFKIFSAYETGQSVGGAKTGGPREKPPGTPASRTWLVSHEPVCLMSLFDWLHAVLAIVMLGRCLHIRKTSPCNEYPPELHFYIVSRLMGKPTICIGENKDADQLRGNREADRRLCFRFSDIPRGSA